MPVDLLTPFLDERGRRRGGSDLALEKRLKETAYQQTRRRAALGARALIARHAVVALISLAGGTYLIRSLGPEQWASYTVAYYLVVFLDWVFAACLLGYLIRTPDEPGERDRAAGVAIAHVAGVLAFIAIVAVSPLVTAWYGRDELLYCLLAAACCGVAYASRSVSLAFLERRLDYYSIALAEVLDHATFYALAISLVATGHGLPGVALALGVRGVPGAILLRFRSPMPALGRLDRHAVARILRFGLPSVGMGMFVLADGLIPVAVLGGDDAKELAFTATAATLIGYAMTSQVVIKRVSFPSLAALQRDPELFRSSIDRLVRVTNFLVVASVVPLAGLSPIWLPHLLGGEWEPAGRVMVAIGAGWILSTLSSIVSTALTSVGNIKDAFLLRLATTVSYALLAIMLVEMSKLLGVATAFALSQALGGLAAVVLVRRRGYDVPWFRTAGVVASATAVMIAIAFLADRGHSVAAVFACALAACAWLGLMRTDARTVRRMLMPQARA